VGGWAPGSARPRTASIKAPLNGGLFIRPAHCSLVCSPPPAAHPPSLATRAAAQLGEHPLPAGSTPHPLAARLCLDAVRQVRALAQAGRPPGCVHVDQVQVAEGGRRGLACVAFLGSGRTLARACTHAATKGTHVHVFAYSLTHMHARAHAHTHTHTHSHAHGRTTKRARSQACVRVHTLQHSCAHACTLTHTHARTQGPRLTIDLVPASLRTLDPTLFPSEGEDGQV